MSSLTKIIALIGLIIALIAIHEYDKRQEVSQAVTAVHSSYKAEADRRRIIAFQEAEKLATKQRVEREQKDEQIRNIERQLSNARKLLNDRKERPKDSEQSAQAGSSCTGRELYKEDGEFLIREAARADKALIDRDFYYNQYENARKMIEGINNGR